jgi:hypothetical protein
MKIIIINLFIFFAFLISCKQEKISTPTLPNNNFNAAINYGDSILYLKPSALDVIVTPIPKPKSGKYFAFPHGLEIDETTGAINLSKSETGMRYKVMFVANGTTDTLVSKITISGISYKDYYHIQAGNDTLSRPFYNANFSNFSLPGTIGSCKFDVDGSAASQGLSIDANTGIINLKKTIQNGFFGNIANIPNDGAAKEVELSYQLNDRSNKATNKLKIKLYYYKNNGAVSNNLTQLLIDRTELFFRLTTTNTPPDYGKATGAAKPRPPCIIILGT